jgi:hypothetical protein
MLAILYIPLFYWIIIRFVKEKKAPAVDTNFSAKDEDEKDDGLDDL